MVQFGFPIKLKGADTQTPLRVWTKAPANNTIRKSLGDDLLSRAVTSQVPSALAGLTSGFGMGPGVPPPHKSPRENSQDIVPEQNDL